MAKKKTKKTEKPKISDAEFIEMVNMMLEFLTPKQLCEDPLGSDYYDVIAWSEGRNLPTNEERTTVYTLMLRSDVWDDL